jgi:hypothetical protein
MGSEDILLYVVNKGEINTPDVVIFNEQVGKV